MGVNWIKLAEAHVLSTYGDTVSVEDKDKPLNKFGENPALPNGSEANSASIAVAAGFDSLLAKVQP